MSLKKFFVLYEAEVVGKIGSLVVSETRNNLYPILFVLNTDSVGHWSFVFL